MMVAHIIPPARWLVTQVNIRRSRSMYRIRTRGKIKQQLSHLEIKILDQGGAKTARLTYHIAHSNEWVLHRKECQWYTEWQARN